MDTVRDLIERNCAYVRRAAGLVAELDDRVYAATGPGYENGPVGTQVRHIVDYYECFLTGITTGHVDYDRRQRDPHVETDRRVAIARLETIAGRLAGLIDRPTGLAGADDEANARAKAGAVAGNTAGEPGTASLTVSADVVGESATAAPSSPERELQFLMSHTIHHFAVIALVLTAQEVDVDGELGVAPSTLRFWTQAPDVRR